MKSNIEGCVRMCDTCPERADRAVEYIPELRQQIRDNTRNGIYDQDIVLPEVDPLDVDHISTYKNYTIADMVEFGGKEKAPYITYSKFTRDSVIMRTGIFPFTASLEMIKACEGPDKIKKGMFRTTLMCSAYTAAISEAKEVLEPSSFEFYLEFLNEQRAIDRKRK